MKIAGLVLWLCLITVFAFAGELEVKLPSGIDTNIKKIAYNYKIEEELRLFHNVKGREYRDGKMSKQEWIDWQDAYFNPRSRAVSYAIVEVKTLLKESETYNVDLENVFENKLTP